jgi:hypothetical protein
VRVCLPNSERAKVMESGEFQRPDAARPRRIHPEELRERAGHVVMIFRMSMARELERAGCLSGAHRCGRAT